MRGFLFGRCVRAKSGRASVGEVIAKSFLSVADGHCVRRALKGLPLLLFDTNKMRAFEKDL